MDAAAALEDREIVGAALPRGELVPALARVAEVRVRIDEAGHDHTPADLTLHRAGGQLELLPAVATAGREDRAVARRDPAIVHRTDVAGGRSDTRLLGLEWSEREQARAPYEEIGQGTLIQ